MVFWGTRGALEPCPQQGVPFWGPFCEKVAILDPNGDPKIVIFLIFRMKVPLRFRRVFQTWFFIVFYRFSDPPDPWKHMFYLGKTTLLQKAPKSVQDSIYYRFWNYFWTLDGILWHIWIACWIACWIASLFHTFCVVWMTIKLPKVPQKGSNIVRKTWNCQPRAATSFQCLWTCVKIAALCNEITLFHVSGGQVLAQAIKK